MITKKITVISVSILFTKIVIWQLSLIGLEYFFFFSYARCYGASGNNRDFLELYII